MHSYPARGKKSPCHFHRFKTPLNHPSNLCPKTLSLPFATVSLKHLKTYLQL